MNVFFVIFNFTHIRQTFIKKEKKFKKLNLLFLFIPHSSKLLIMEKAGYVVKEGGRYKSWKKRWLVIENDKLSYYRKEVIHHQFI